MTNYFLARVYIEVSTPDGSESFCEHHIVDDENAKFVSLNKNVRIKEVVRTAIKPDAVSSLTKYIGSPTQIADGLIEINGYPIDAESNEVIHSQG